MILSRLKPLALAILCSLLVGTQSSAATLETRTIRSEAMNKDISANVIIPEGYAASKDSYPVVYMLHGAGGNYRGWNGLQKTLLSELADQYHAIIVFPDALLSWYFDAPADPAYRYETHVSSEVVKAIDQNYRTIAAPKGRAIAGISMGGHGAMFLALRHKEIFGAVGSMSGGLDIRPFPKGWDISKRLGTIEEHPENWEAFTAINQISNIKDGDLAIMIDCGVDDFFLKVNRAFHEALVKQKIGHDYIERPGGHNFKCWENTLQYQMLFFHRFFTKPAAAPAAP